MGSSTAQVRRHGWLELFAIVTIILGMIGGVGVVTAAPADAAECSDQGVFELHRLMVEFGGTDDGTLDGTAYLDTDVDDWCYANNDVIFTGHTPSLHISCSENLVGITVTGPGVPGGSAVITEFWLDSRNPANNKPNRGLCQAESTFPSFDPDISLVKTAVGGDLVTGDGDPFLSFSSDDAGPKTAGYSYRITNTGDEPLVNLSLTDDRIVAGDLDLDCPAVLAVGASCTATGSEDFTLADAPDTITNTGTVTADGQESGDDVSDTDPATIDLVVEVVEFGPAISLVKTAVGGDLVTGDGDPFLVFSAGDAGPKTAGYSYLITNTGDEPLVNLDLTDDRIVAGDLDVDCPAVLAVGASCTATGSEDFTLADAPETITNTGTVTADGQESGDDVSDTDPATIDLVVASGPAISLVKDAVVGAGSDLTAGTPNPELVFAAGDTAPKTAGYSYRITNIGDEPLVDIGLTDDRIAAGDLDLDCPPALAVGASCTATGSEDFTLADAEADADGAVTNTGTVIADGQESGERVSDTDPATIVFSIVFDQPPLEPIEIDLVKEVVADAGDVTVIDGRATVNWSQAEYEAGDSKTVRYRFTVTNVSDATIVDVELIDPMLGDEPIIAVSDGVTLEPDEFTVVEVDHLMSVDEAFPDGPIASKVDNVAMVTGANEARDQVTDDTAEASVFTELVLSEARERDPVVAAGDDARGALPLTGFADGGLVLLALLLLWLGAAVMWLSDRPRPIRS